MNSGRADVFAVNETGQTALHYARSPPAPSPTPNPQPPTPTLFHKMGSDWPTTGVHMAAVFEMPAALWRRSSRNRVACVRVLLTAAAGRAAEMANTADKSNYTPFHRVKKSRRRRRLAGCGSSAVACALAAFACLAVSRLFGMQATARGYTAVMELLIEHGADASAADSDGNTGLHIAVIAATAVYCPTLLAGASTPPVVFAFERDRL